MFTRVKKNIIGLTHCILITLHFHGGLKRRWRFFNFANLARRNGVILHRIERIAKDYLDAWYALADMSSQEKKWYISHGFNPSRKYFCGVMPDNYKRYMSDFEFYNPRNYVNKSNYLWFDNKLNTFYLLYPFSTWLPKHYFFINDSKVLPLDIKEKHNYTTDSILSLLKEKGLLAAKKCYGGHGEGFYKFEYKDGEIIANDGVLTEREFLELVKRMRGYIITDFIKPAAWIRKMAGENSFAVIRAMTIYDDNDGPQFERIMMRIGTEKSGPTQAGHDFLYVGIDKTGKLFNCFYEYSDYCWKKMDNHPETGETINGRILPNMDDLKILCKKVAGYLPNTPYLIFDIIPTDDTFLILEINSHGQPFNFEPFDPVKGSNYFTKLFSVLQ